MLLAMVEAGRAILLRRAGLASGTARDKIPLGRWLLSPWRTWLLWRRMILWQITDYRAALETEADLRRAHTLLRMWFGRRWERKAPADLVWMLEIPPFANEAYARVDALTESEEHQAPTEVESNDRTAESDLHAAPTTPPQTVTATGTSQLEEVMRINEHHWIQRGRPISAETVRKHMRVGADRARELTQAVRAMGRAAVQRGLASAID